MPSVEAEEANVYFLYSLFSFGDISYPFTILCPMAARIAKYTKRSIFFRGLPCLPCGLCVYVESRPDRLEDSPRIFYVVRAPSTSSPKKVINWRMSPSEMPSPWCEQSNGDICHLQKRGVFSSQVLCRIRSRLPQVREAPRCAGYSMYFELSASGVSYLIGVISSM